MNEHPDLKPHKRTYTVLGFLSLLGVAIALHFMSAKLTPVPEPSQATTEAVESLPPISATDIHSDLGYALDQVAQGKIVPPVFVNTLKVDLDRIPDISEKKETFFRIMLPHIASENDRIRAERAKIISDPENVPDTLYDKYAVEHGDINELLARIDVVPASLVLSQAAIESGWGTSRFARDGNNFFGMRTYDADSKGIDPKQADGFKVMVFKDIADSVRAYMKNLNTNNAYNEFRMARAQHRTQDRVPTGRTMVNFLTAYSEIPEKYVTLLLGMIDHNNLDRFDGVRLDGGRRDSK